MWAEVPLERSMDLREQPADAVARRGHFSREVFIKPTKQGELRELNQP